MKTKIKVLKKYLDKNPDTTTPFEELVLIAYGQYINGDLSYGAKELLETLGVLKSRKSDRKCSVDPLTCGCECSPGNQEIEYEEDPEEDDDGTN